MANVHSLTNAISTIAYKVNAHQIMIEELKKTDLADGQGPFAASSAGQTPPIGREEVSGMLAALKEELASRQTRDKGILEASLNHSNDQKISLAVSRIEERLRRIEERLDALAVSNAGAGPGAAGGLPADAADHAAAPVTEPVAVPEPAPAPAPPARASRRRGKAAAAADETCPPGTLTLE